MIIIGEGRSVTSLDMHDGSRALYAQKRVLIGPDQGAENFVMRLFTLGEGGCSPYHTHRWEHEVFIISGRGKVKGATGEPAVAPGNFVFVPGNEEHQFLNAGTEPFEFLCVVPREGEG